MAKYQETMAKLKAAVNSIANNDDIPTMEELVIVDNLARTKDGQKMIKRACFALRIDHTKVHDSLSA